MAALDFITALGRVLHDGAARDAFAADPAAYARSIALRETDVATFIRLDPADLEFQARVLLRKRYGLVREVLPRTCENLGGDAWPEFVRYGRSHAPAGTEQTTTDALGFTRHLGQARPAALCPLERKRCQFVLGRRSFALHFVRCTHSPTLQVLRRQSETRWQEWLIYLSL